MQKWLPLNYSFVRIKIASPTSFGKWTKGLKKWLLISERAGSTKYVEIRIKKNINVKFQDFVQDSKQI